MGKRTVDARGLACPLPVVNAKKAALELHQGDELTVLVDNEIAVQNLKKFARQKGFAASGEKKAEREYVVVMIIGESGAPAPAQQTQEEAVCAPDMIGRGMTVVLSANVMGMGEEKLGKALMKAFVFALTKQDTLPENIVCYNSGAYLTCEGADTLEDMKLLAAEGVNILTCGTCLDFYGIKDRLSVGSVTNMYEIVETMERSKALIRP